MLRRIAVLCTLVMVLACAGCGEGSLFSTSVWDPFGFGRVFGSQGEPVRIGLTSEYRGVFDIQQWGKAAPWDPLAKELSEHLGRPVVIENLEPFQIQFHLAETGRLDFALVAAKGYMEMTEEGPAGRIIALSEARTRQGVIVAKADSDIKTLADLKGRRFAFGPKGDAVLFADTVATLEDAGVGLSDLKFLLPGVPQCHISSDEAAKEVAYVMGTESGVIEAEEYDAYPETGGKWSLFSWTFSKDQFRELGRTPEMRVETIGEGPLVARDGLDEELVASVREFLVTARHEHPEVVHALGFSSFRMPPADPAGEVKRLAASAGS